MAKILLDRTVKYNGVLYYAYSEIDVLDEDLEEMSKFGEIIEGKLVAPVEEPIEKPVEEVPVVETKKTSRKKTGSK